MTRGNRASGQSGAPTLGQLKLVPAGDGLEFGLKVVPGASRSRILGPYGDVLRVAVSAPPEGGKANREVVQVLAAGLAVPEDRVELVAGLRGVRKRVRVVGLTASGIRERLAPLCGAG